MFDVSGAGWIPLFCKSLHYHSCIYHDIISFENPLKTMNFIFIRFPRQTPRFQPGSAGPELEMSMVILFINNQYFIISLFIIIIMYYLLLSYWWCGRLKKPSWIQSPTECYLSNKGWVFTQSSHSFRKLGIPRPLAFGPPDQKRSPPLMTLFIKKRMPQQPFMC